MDLERAVERLDPLGEALQPAALRVGAAAAVVDDVDSVCGRGAGVVAELPEAFLQLAP